MARIWILGGGLIGCGWAAAFAGAGHDVTVIDPDPAVADRIATVQAQALPVLQGLGTLSPRATTPAHVATAAEAGPPRCWCRRTCPKISI